MKKDGVKLFKEDNPKKEGSYYHNTACGPLTAEEFQTKWLIFSKDYLPKKITEVWEIRSLSDATLLGIVKWHAPWRCYSFYPMANTIFNSTCIKDILDFINKLMEARKKPKK